MECNYHTEFTKQFSASGKRVGWSNCCDNMGCFSFHPNVNPDFLDKPENLAYIKENNIQVWRNLTKEQVDELDKTRSQRPKYIKRA